MVVIFGETAKLGSAVTSIPSMNTAAASTTFQASAAEFGVVIVCGLAVKETRIGGCVIPL